MAPCTSPFADGFTTALSRIEGGLEKLYALVTLLGTSTVEKIVGICCRLASSNEPGVMSCWYSCYRHVFGSLVMICWNCKVLQHS